MSTQAARKHRKTPAPPIGISSSFNHNTKEHSCAFPQSTILWGTSCESLYHTLAESYLACHDFFFFGSSMTCFDHLAVRILSQNVLGFPEYFVLSHKQPLFPQKFLLAFWLSTQVIFYLCIICTELSSP